MTLLDIPTEAVRQAPPGVLLGPADANHYRVKVGRSRYYRDPLPGCDIAPEDTEWTGPSISTLKPPFANKYVPMRTIAEMPDSEWARLAQVDAETRYEAVKAHEKVAGSVNMDRGSIIHLWAEDLIFGQPMRDAHWFSPTAKAQADRYRDALVSFFDTYQPEAVVAEAVCINRTMNGIGYGGTADLFARVEGAVWLIDWKSRGSDHDAYIEEAAQIGGYAASEYMIVADGNGGAKRERLPDLAGGLIVSIRPDGFRVYPVEL